MKWRAFGRMPQWVRLSEWLGVAAAAILKLLANKLTPSTLTVAIKDLGEEPNEWGKYSCAHFNLVSIDGILAMRSDGD